MSMYSNFETAREKVIPLLRSTRLFGGLNADQVKEVAASMTPRQFTAGVTLFHQGMPGTTMYLIETGSVRVFGVGLTGQEHTFNTFGPGDFFGELSVFDGKQRTASAITLADTALWMLSKDSFDRLVGKYPPIARAAIEVLAGRVRTAANHVENLIFQDVMGRIAYELLHLAQRHGRETDAGLMIDLPLTQTDLASIVGSTRESVNKMLAQLRRRGLIEIDGTEIQILDREGLVKIVQQRGR